MMRRLLPLALMMLVSASALAAPKAQPVHSQPVVHSSGSLSATPHMVLSGPFTLISGNLYLGPEFSATWEVAPRVWVGGETGFQFHPGDFSGFAFPIMPTVIYFPMLDMGPSVTPFVGLSMGVSIDHVSVGIVSDTSLDFAWHLIFGVDFSQNLMADIKLGTFGSSFAFAPEIGYRF